MKSSNHVRVTLKILRRILIKRNLIYLFLQLKFTTGIKFEIQNKIKDRIEIFKES